MITSEQKEKLNLFLNLKKNPALSLMTIIKEIKQDILAFLQKESNTMEEKMNVNLREEVDKIKIEFQEIVNSPVKGVFEHLKEIKGEKGDNPTNDELLGLIKPLIPIVKDGYTPTKGKDYFDGKNGVTPIAGKDYPTTQQVLNIIKSAVSQIKIPEPKEPYIPKKGVDYFNVEDVSTITNEVKDALKQPLKLIQNDLKFIKEELKKLKIKGEGLRGAIHRGGADYSMETPTGVCNGVNTTFTLAETPYASTMVMFYVNGQLMKKDSDYTISNKTITTITPPPTDSVTFVMYRK